LTFAVRTLVEAWATPASRTNHAAAAPQNRAARPRIRAGVAILVLQVLFIGALFSNRLGGGLVSRKGSKEAL